VPGKPTQTGIEGIVLDICTNSNIAYSARLVARVGADDARSRRKVGREANEKGTIRYYFFPHDESCVIVSFSLIDRT
jgi:hypothetical protein